MTQTAASVVAVSSSARHSFSKQSQIAIQLLASLGVAGDAHCGVTTQHLYRKRRNPSQPNLCQVHLFSEELLVELAAHGFRLAPGDIGENILTHGLDLLALPLGTHLKIGESAVLEVTGLRTPCRQMDDFRPGLQQHCWGPRTATSKKTCRAGIMCIVLQSGSVRSGDAIHITLPELPYRALPQV